MRKRVGKVCLPTPVYYCECPQCEEPDKKLVWEELELMCDGDDLEGNYWCCPTCAENVPTHVQ